jgi:hypothetical protein
VSIVDFEQEVDWDEIDAQRHHIEDEQRAELEAAEIIDTLNGAALYIDAHGWCRGEYFNRTGGVAHAFPPACALGAIGMAMAGNTETAMMLAEYADPVFEFARLLDPSAYRAGRSAYDIVSNWNDDQAIDGAEVASTLRAAAEQLASPNLIVRQ